MIASIVSTAIIVVIAMPFVSAQVIPVDPLTNVKTLKAQGIATQKIDEHTVKSPANFTLTLQATSTNGIVKKFDVTGGTVVINGVSYTIESGNGGVLARRHLILLQAQGKGPDGKTVTFELAGRYFWMGGHLWVARIGARLQTDNANYTLLLRAAIRL